MDVKIDLKLFKDATNALVLYSQLTLAFFLGTIVSYEGTKHYFCLKETSQLTLTKFIATVMPEDDDKALLWSK